MLVAAASTPAPVHGTPGRRWPGTMAGTHRCATTGTATHAGPPPAPRLGPRRGRGRGAARAETPSDLPAQTRAQRHDARRRRQAPPATRVRAAASLPLRPGSPRKGNGVLLRPGVEPARRRFCRRVKVPVPAPCRAVELAARAARDPGALDARLLHVVLGPLAGEGLVAHSRERTSHSSG